MDELGGATEWDHRVVRAPSCHKTIETDTTTGEISWKVHYDEGVNEDLTHGLVSGCAYQERFPIRPVIPGTRDLTLFQNYGVPGIR